MPTLPTAESFQKTAESFCGEIVWPHDPGYDVRRRAHNGMIDKRPAVVARALGIADIVDIVRLAASTSADLAVRGGGHNIAGLSCVDDGILLDLSLMKGIHVDAARRTARVEAGVVWRELNRATQLHGLATTGELCPRPAFPD